MSTRILILGWFHLVTCLYLLYRRLLMITSGLCVMDQWTLCGLRTWTAVLDDNKMLCLANSERIKLNSTIHMLFEVQDLAVASPATVSRYSINFFLLGVVWCMLILENWGGNRMYKHGLSISFPLNYLTPPRYTCVTCSLTNTHMHTLTLTLSLTLSLTN